MLPVRGGPEVVVIESRHRVVQHRTGIAGVEALSFVSDRAFPRHGHDGYGIGVLLDGGHRSWSGRGAVTAEPGDVITVNPGEIHDGLPVAGAARSWRTLYLDRAAMTRELTGETPREVEIARPALRDPETAALILRAFARLASADPDPLAAEEALLAAVMRFFERHGARPLPRRRPSPPVARALQRIEDAPEQATRLAELAALSGVSRFQLLRGFVRDVGLTPHAYLLQRRVRLARDALRTGAPPADAAVLAGFADQSHLTRVFARQFGVTPGRYRAAVAD